MKDLNLMWQKPIVFYNGFTDNEPKIPRFEGEDLVELLTNFADPLCSVESCDGRECPAKKNALCWSPVEYQEGATRGNDNVAQVNYAVFDLDHMKPGELEGVRQTLKEYEHVIHSTHTHAIGDECYRLIFPLSRPALPAEWLSVHSAIRQVTNLPADELHDLARLYACPTQRKGVPAVSLHQRGKPIDVDEALEVAALLRGEKKETYLSPPAAKEAVSYDLDSLRELLTNARRSKASGDTREKEQAAIFARILDGDALAEPGSRDKTLLRACGLVAYWLPSDTPWTVVLELLRPSLSKMECQPEGFDHWVEEARDMYERQMISRKETDIKKAEDDERFEEFKKKIAKKSIKEQGKIADDEAEGWEMLLIEGKDGPKAVEFNVDLILTCAPEVRNTIVWNEFAKKIEIKGGPFEGVPINSLDGKVAGWLQSNYQIMAGETIVGKSLLRVARDNPYNPIADYLEELAWDGSPRIDRFLEDYLGADVLEEDRAKYVRVVSRRWLISLVARALRPGCKVDTVLVLEGDQGAFKSSAFEALVGKDYFLDTAIDIGSKDALQAIASVWLVELGELASFRRAEVDSIKQFITSKIDRFRPPFARTTEDFPRRCVFVGSTNRRQYLTDTTGNRRYWPVKVRFESKPELVGQDRDQIFAEAVAAFKQGERWWLKGEENKLANDETEERLDESTIMQAIDRWWFGEQPSKRLRKFLLLDITESVLKMTPDRVSHGMKTEIGVALTKLGFVRAGRDRHYEPAEWMLEAEQRLSEQRKTNLALVKSITDKVKK